MNRDEVRKAISERLDGRQLVWFGTRGDDVESVTELPEFSASFSIIGMSQRRHWVDAASLESYTGRRVDLDAYELDEEPDVEAFGEFRRRALRVLSHRSAVFTYRPSVFVSALCFARRDRCRYLGMFKDHQSAFEHKPWVESSIARLDVPVIPWDYIADEEQLDTLRSIAAGPIMLRRSRTSGGTGLLKVDDASQLSALWPNQPEAYVSVAPFIDGGIPVNVGAVVWSDGGITIHPASLQLIGIEGSTTRPFGYCGNDFGEVRQLDRAVLDEIEGHVRVIGSWLRAHGYLGAFGVDFLVKDGRPLFTEVNPRFQGSTHLSCELSVELDRSCILLDHVAASLGMPAPPSLRLSDYTLASPAAHLVIHWTGSAEARIDGRDADAAFRKISGFRRSDVLTTPDLVTDPGATVARITMSGVSTSTGFDLCEPWRSALDEWSNRATPVPDQFVPSGTVTPATMKEG